MWLLLLLVAASPAWAFTDGWKTAGATYFDAPDYWKAAFQPGKFGDLYGNSCGYLDRTAGVEPSNAGFPLPFDGVGAVSDSMPEHTGKKYSNSRGRSCGRCYEIRCKTGLVVSGDGVTPKSIYEGYYLPRYAPDLLDPEGRPWPGKPDEYKELRYTQCREDVESIVITIIDSCPCVYIGGRKQASCCGPLPHFDLSFWAFNKLAHPLYGNMMMEYRPVACDTREPLQTEKPYISDTVYGDGPGAGWGWRSYGEQQSTLLAENEGLYQSTATCLILTPGGGVSFHCRGCEKEGFQPFNKKYALEFWIRSRSTEVKSLNGEGGVLALRLSLSQMHNLEYSETGTFTKPSTFCNSRATLADYTPVGETGDWLQFQIPFTDFQCEGELRISGVNRIVMAAPAGYDLKDVEFCLDEVRII
ncbi:hypothetical protein BSKO_10055 [Bryopsis sp. KO-2023]|nr:hypothetical protein BSKO_10055 [Bryopsis sp. KO-2023]